jgi:hypothetical protein
LNFQVTAVVGVRDVRQVAEALVNTRDREDRR